MSGKLGGKAALVFFLDTASDPIEKCFLYFKSNMSQDWDIHVPNDTDTFGEKLIFALLCLDALWNSDIVRKIDTTIDAN